MHNIMSVTRPSSAATKLTAVQGTAVAPGRSLDSDLRLVPFGNRLRSSIRILDTGPFCVFAGDHLWLTLYTQGVLKEPNLAKEAALDLFSVINSYGQGDLSGMATTAMGFLKKASIGSSARQRTVMTKTSPADVIMFSGSKDTQTSSVPVPSH